MLEVVADVGQVACSGVSYSLVQIGVGPPKPRILIIPFYSPGPLPAGPLRGRAAKGGRGRPSE